MVKHGRMLDENCLERRCVAWDLIGQNLEMPIAEKLSECFLKIWAQRPRGSQVEPVSPPPTYGRVNGLEGKCTIRLLDIVCQSTKRIA